MQLTVAEKRKITRFRDKVMAEDCTPGYGGSFGEILCHRIHTDGLTFRWLAGHWNISVEFLGLVIYDHCKALMGYKDGAKDPWDQRP